jgi:hypothetical protein
LVARRRPRGGKFADRRDSGQQVKSGVRRHRGWPFQLSEKPFKCGGNRLESSWVWLGIIAIGRGVFKSTEIWTSRGWGPSATFLRALWPHVLFLRRGWNLGGFRPFAASMSDRVIRVRKTGISA